MDYKEKYEMALEGIQEILGSGGDSIKMSRLQLRLQGIFPELKESEDERIRKDIISMCQTLGKEEWVAWLEKQGEHAKFRDSIQVGDKVTRNKDGVLVNLSQLKRVAKKDEKQGEQKPVWSEEDENWMKESELIISYYTNDENYKNKFLNWLKSLRPQSTWKPSEEMLEALYRAVPENVMEISEDEMLLDKLYQGLKYGKVLSEK